MTFYSYNDGDKITDAVFSDLSSKDLLSLADVEMNRNSTYSISCVGFSMNRSEDTLVILPKHYTSSNFQSLEDFLPVFNSIQKVQSQARGKEWGRSQSLVDPSETSCNYPFRAFFQIYDYYRIHGLHLAESRTYSPDRGKVNWKRTLSRTNFFLADGRLIFHPLTRENLTRINHFVTEAMTHAINRTLRLFGAIIKLPPVPQNTAIITEPKQYETALRKLRKIRTETFDDRSIALIEALIDFYSYRESGQGFYFKSRNYEYVWQKAVSRYVQCRFMGIDQTGKPQFSVGDVQNNHFKPDIVSGFNEGKPKQPIEIDHYWYDPHEGRQYVFDAKYYSSSPALDYKQVFYTLLKALDPKRAQDETLSALILPSDDFGVRKHFSLVDEYSQNLLIKNPKLEVFEIYLDCKTVIESFQDVDS